jgi:hypothetical protein
VRVLVCGSRDWTDYQAIRDRIRDLHDQHAGALEILHGDARGADEMADHVALMLNIDSLRFAADWKRYGRAAGPLRNRQMLDAKPHLVLAFQRNGSRGTQHTIDEARKRGIPVEVHAPETAATQPKLDA